jgi:Tol biopolymer transport system component
VRNVTFEATGGFVVSATERTLAFRTVESAEDRQLAWYDRGGRELGVLDVPKGARDPQLSWDGRALAFETFPGDSRNRDIEILWFADGQRRRLTSEIVDDADEQWSGDGTRILFARGAGDKRQFVVRDVSGSTESVVPLKPDDAMWPASWSPDGRYLAYSEGDTACVIADLQGASSDKPIRIEQARWCQFSPDSRYLAYVNLGEGNDVFVEPFPPTGARWGISQNGGTEPRWHPTGKELFFLALDQTLMAAEVKFSPQFQATNPRPLFRPRIPVPMRTGVAFNYAVAPDGGFLVNTVKAGTPPAAIRVILNWQQPEQ